MGVSVVIGGQFGSEGKGKVAYLFAQKLSVSSVVRVGGINSGHTVVDQNGDIHIFRILPTSAIDKNIVCVLPAGSYLNVALLFQEIVDSNIDRARIKIHPNAVIITDELIHSEQDSVLKARIGSTASGTGIAVSKRVNRCDDILLAKDVECLKPFLCDTTEFLRNEIDSGREILIEGTQGYGLSNLHTPYFPYATSRDTTAAGFLSEAGLSPFDVTNIIMVVRSYPIRVAGNSGPLPNEITWEYVTEAAHANKPIQEYTSVTKKLRRVAEFDAEIIKKAIAVNRPNIIVMNHMDYIGKTHTKGRLDQAKKDFIKKVERDIGQQINYIGLNNCSIDALKGDFYGEPY